MPEVILNKRDSKLVQWLGEAHAKEAELEADLTAHIALTQKESYKKRLRQHLTETRDHKRNVAAPVGRSDEVYDARRKQPDASPRVIGTQRFLVAERILAKLAGPGLGSALHGHTARNTAKELRPHFLGPSGRTQMELGPPGDFLAL